MARNYLSYNDLPGKRKISTLLLIILLLSASIITVMYCAVDHGQLFNPHLGTYKTHLSTQILNQQQIQKFNDFKNEYKIQGDAQDVRA
jgi:hypothetical protein